VQHIEYLGQAEEEQVVAVAGQLSGSQQPERSGQLGSGSFPRADRLRPPGDRRARRGRCPRLLAEPVPDGVAGHRSFKGRTARKYSSRCHVSQSAQRVPCARIGRFGVDLHRDADLAVPRQDLHGDARVDVKRSKQ
jgi:hypothetical protein